MPARAERWRTRRTRSGHLYGEAMGPETWALTHLPVRSCASCPPPASSPSGPRLALFEAVHCPHHREEVDLDLPTVGLDLQATLDTGFARLHADGERVSGGRHGLGDEAVDAL